MRFKLSSLLVLFTFLAFAIGLGYQMHLLRRQVGELKTELQTLKRRPIQVVLGQSAGQNQNSRPVSPFRLLNAEEIVHPSIERGMKADEWERQQRFNQRLQVEVPGVVAPEEVSPGLGNRSR